MQHDARFCLIGNHQHTLVPALQSRVTKLLFTPIAREPSKQIAQKILDAEGIAYEDAALDAIYGVTRGDMRQYTNVMQAMVIRSYENADSDAPGKLTYSLVESILCLWNSDQIEEFVQKLRDCRIGECVRYLELQLQEHVHDFGKWLQDSFYYLLHRIPDDELAAFCEEVATIEYNASFVVHTSIQTFCLVACYHKYARRMIAV